MLSFVLYPYVYLLARAAFLEQSRRPDRSRARARLRAVGDVPARRAAARAARHRRRRRARADGDARGFRHGRVFRRADVHHRDLPRVVLARRSCRRGTARSGAARFRRRSCSCIERVDARARALRRPRTRKRCATSTALRGGARGGAVVAVRDAARARVFCCRRGPARACVARGDVAGRRALRRRSIWQQRFARRDHRRCSRSALALLVAYAARSTARRLVRAANRVAAWAMRCPAR